MRTCSGASLANNKLDYYVFIKIGKRKNFSEVIAKTADNVFPIYFQQKGQITTIQYADNDGEIHRHEFNDISPINESQKLSAEDEKKLLFKIYELRIPILIKISNNSLKKDRDKVKNKWLNGEILTKEEKILYRTTSHAARTVDTSQFEENTTAFHIYNNPLFCSQPRPTIKAYTGNYNSFPAGMIRSEKHKANKTIKAIRVRNDSSNVDSAESNDFKKHGPELRL